MINSIQQKIKSLIVILFITVSYQASSQIELQNKVVDFATLLPLESASIYIQNTTIGTISNKDGKFLLVVPKEHIKDTLVVSSIGYKSYKAPVGEFDNSMEIFLEEDIASLDEVVLVAENRPKTGVDIFLRAIEELPNTLPDSSYLQKGFIRHKERNKVEFKWLIESAITLYDEGFKENQGKAIKINVDEVRKSYDLRDIDSVLVYTSYLKSKLNDRSINAKNLRNTNIAKNKLVKAIRWNDTRVNGLMNLFNGKLNLVRNSSNANAVFGKNVIKNHSFKLDTVLVENERKVYKIKISKGLNYVDLKTKGIYNDGFEPNGWVYIYWDNYAIKKVEYELTAASPAQKSRSKTLFDTYLNHKLVLNFMEYNDKMYPNYVYYQTPKLVNVGSQTNKKQTQEEKETRYYYTVQEIVFTEIIDDKEQVVIEANKIWDADLFSPKPYNEEFWKNYNTLLESEEEEQMIEDLTQRSSLFKN